MALYYQLFYSNKEKRLMKVWPYQKGALVYFPEEKNSLFMSDPLLKAMKASHDAGSANGCYTDAGPNSLSGNAWEWKVDAQWIELSYTPSRKKSILRFPADIYPLFLRLMQGMESDTNGL